METLIDKCACQCCCHGRRAALQIVVVRSDRDEAALASYHKPPPPADRGLNVRMGSESCLECYRSKRMSSADLLSFARSTSIHSPSLAAVFKVKDASTAPAGDGVAQRARSPRVSRL